MQSDNKKNLLIARTTIQNMKSSIKAFQSPPMDELNDLNPSFLIQIAILYKELDDLEKNIHTYSPQNLSMCMNKMALKCQTFSANYTEILNILTQNMQEKIVSSKRLLQEMQKKKDINDSNPQLLQRAKELDSKLKNIVCQADLKFETLKEEFFGPLEDLRYDYKKASSQSFKPNVKLEAMKEEFLSPLQDLDRDYTKASSQSFTKFIKKQQSKQAQEREM